MKYISTRGRAPSLTFEEVMLTGLANDGGLYVPEVLPQISTAELNAWRSLDYADLAGEIMSLFVDDCFTREQLSEMVSRAYRRFDHQAVAPLKQLQHDTWVLELFHGPTFAFKDFALQVLGQLLDGVLEKRNERVVILGATSGDTGSAAIEGCRHSKFVDICILHPHQRTSLVQRRQMTTVSGDHIHNFAVEGNFDDCQNLVKASFLDQGFVGKNRRLVAVNSINWARIMVQIVYYFYAALRLGAPDRGIYFAVPSGNFGNIYAGYLAQQMGLPILGLHAASNTNDVLYRFFQHGELSLGEITPTLSPSMDVGLPSNFERLLFDLCGRDADQLNQLMVSFRERKIEVPQTVLAKAQQLFSASHADDAQTLATINDVFQRYQMIVDPHTAVGLKGVLERDWSAPVVALATAHAAKFPNVLEKANVPEVNLAAFEQQASLAERYTVVANDSKIVQQAIHQALNAEY